MAAPPQKHDPASATARQADVRTRRHGGLGLSTKVMRRPPLTRGSGGFRLGSWRRRQRHPRLSGAFSTRTTPHPALIPHDVAGSSRPRPPIPATPGSENPALAGNPRLSPARQEAPRPARHAGGRGFESRRSRKSTCKSAPFVAALGANDRRPPDRSRTDPARGFQVRLRRGKALEIGTFLLRVQAPDDLPALESSRADPARERPVAWKDPFM